jgi:predicted heme/steroid binding protein/uncharacterized membrane protein
MREFDPEDVAEFNGKEGKPAYVVHRGRVVDVTASRLWQNGLHMRRHQAGADLTSDLKAAPHGEEMLERYPQVGVVRKSQIALAQTLPPFLEALLQRFPMLKRHPHPMTVHFPIAFIMAATAFNVLFLTTGVLSFEVTAFHCLGAAVLLTPIAMATGFFTWWYNYLARPLLPVRIKMRLTPLLWGAALVAFLWRLWVPDILQSMRPASTLYLLLLFAFIPLVTAVGWFGAQMTFPVERD